MIFALRVILAAALLVSSALAKSPEATFVYVPDLTQPDAGTLEGETWSRDSDTASLWLTRIDEATRTKFVQRRAGLELDPFMTAPGRQTGGFLAFHVLVENKTAARMVFQPQACRLRTSAESFQAPLDLPTIMAVFSMMGRPAPDGIERIRGAIIDGEVILGPGERRDGLFIFHTYDEPPKRYQIDIGATLTGGDPFGFSAHYRRVRVKP